MTDAPIKLDASQARAVDLMCDAASRLCVVTGGPGTGKSTCARQALDRLDARRLTYALAAPTGKAARRIQETTGREATTIHRLLGFAPGAGFMHTAANPLRFDVVLIDESSMLDIVLAESLLDACQEWADDTGRWHSTRLVLIGDQDQLPPVGAGRPFADLIASGHVPVARLTTLHRAAAGSWVCTQSREVIAGSMPLLETRPDFGWAEADEREAAVTLLRESVEYLMREHGAAAVQAIIPQNVGPAGCARLNLDLQATLNPATSTHGPGASWKVEGAHLRIGDRVIQTKNDYLLDGGRGVMNGECGTVRAIRIDPTGRELVVGFDDGREVAYAPANARNLRLAYALTCHRAQGSEWPWVVVLCHSTHTQMLTRGWLYTAITRAKKGVVLVGDRIGIERAVKNTSDVRRNTGLVERLHEGCAASEPREGSEAA